MNETDRSVDKKPPVVLIAEDDPDQAYYLESLLSANGFRTVTAQNGKEALELLQQHGVDLVVSDILMPVMDGFLLCKEVKSDPDLAAIPFVFHTATYTDESDEHLAFQVGADAFIRKPVDPEAFLRSLNEVIHRPSRRQGEPVVASGGSGEADVFKLYSQRLIVRLERKMAALKESEERYRSLFQFSNEGIFVHDLAGKILDVNPRVEEMLGYSRDELLNMTLRDLHGPEDLEKSRQVFERFRETGEAMFDIGFRKKNGERMIAAVSSRKLKMKGEDIALGVVRDVTEKRREEERQRIIYGIAKAAAEAADIPALLEGIHDVLGSVLDTTNFLVALYHEESQTFSLPYQKDQFDHFETFPIGKTTIGYVLRTGKTLFAREKDILDLVKAGEIDIVGTPAKVWLGIPLKVQDTVVGVLVVQHYENEHAYSTDDVALLEFASTQIAQVILRKQHEEKLNRLATVIEQVSQVVVVTDPEGRIQYVNPAFERLTGYSREEAIGENPRILKSGKQDQAFYEELWNTISAGKDWRGVFVNKRKDGSLFRVDSVISPVLDETGRIINYGAVMRDITREHELEEGLRQAQKMEAIGQLAGGIAHDFNNILSAILGYSEMALNNLPTENRVHRYVEQIKKSGERAARLTKQLLGFSRKQMIQPKLLDLNETILDLKKMLDPLIGEDIRLALRLAETVPAVMADPGQIEQIMINLVVNAADALRDLPPGKKREITVETRTETVTAPEDVTLDRLAPGAYVVLTVRDTGPGMPEEIVAKIFDPFFTTKGVGKGTGLGLSTVYGIVKQNEGDILVDSTLGEGTTFDIYWPAVDRNGNAGEREHLKPTAIRGGGETVLVVEDDEELRDMAVQMIETGGYRVLSAESAEKALQLLQNREEDIHLLFTDIVMTGMDGWQLARRVREIRPAMKIVLVSGYPAERIPKRQMEAENIRFLSKPYTLQEVTGIIRSALDDVHP